MAGSAVVRLSRMAIALIAVVVVLGLVFAWSRSSPTERDERMLGPTNLPGRAG